MKKKMSIKSVYIFGILPQVLGHYLLWIQNLKGMVLSDMSYQIWIQKNQFKFMMDQLFYDQLLKLKKVTKESQGKNKPNFPCVILKLEPSIKIMLLVFSVNSMN